jgi:SHS2 domain-containing protein
MSLMALPTLAAPGLHHNPRTPTRTRSADLASYLYFTLRVSIRAMSKFELFEHTADVGLRVEAGSLEELFVAAARGVYSLIVENPDAIERRHDVTIELAAEDIEGLFVDWLRELIYRFETEHLLLCQFHVQILQDNRRVFAKCGGEPADWNRHMPGNELKAVTYHGLRVQATTAGWEAEVILDI